MSTVPPGLKPKDLCLIPERLALALQADGWYIRSRICWAKKSCMPESVTDRPTSAWEHIWLMAKAATYTYDAEAVKTKAFRGSAGSRFDKGETAVNGKGRVQEGYRDQTEANLRNFWLLGPEPYPEAHFATFPSEIPRRAIKAGTSEKGQCGGCGKAFERITEATRTFESGSGRSGNQPIGKNGVGLQGGGETKDIRRGPVIHSKHLGWRPSCKCNAATVPQIVLDPFHGSGTTAMVAKDLNRRYIGIELNEEYIKMSEKRIAQEVLPF